MFRIRHNMIQLRQLSRIVVLLVVVVAVFVVKGPVTYVLGQQTTEITTDTLFCRCELEGENLYPETELWERFYGWSKRFNEPTTGIFNRRGKNRSGGLPYSANHTANNSNDTNNYTLTGGIDRETPDFSPGFQPTPQANTTRRDLMQSVFDRSGQRNEETGDSESSDMIRSETKEEGPAKYQEDRSESAAGSGPQSVFTALNRIKKPQQPEENSSSTVSRTATSNSDNQQGPQSVFTVLNRIRQDKDNELTRDHTDNAAPSSSTMDFVVINGVTVLPRFDEACRSNRLPSHNRMLQQHVVDDKADDQESKESVLHEDNYKVGGVDYEEDGSYNTGDENYNTGDDSYDDGDDSYDEVLDEETAANNFDDESEGYSNDNVDGDSVGHDQSTKTTKQSYVRGIGFVIQSVRERNPSQPKLSRTRHKRRHLQSTKQEDSGSGLIFSDSNTVQNWRQFLQSLRGSNYSRGKTVRSDRITMSMMRMMMMKEKRRGRGGNGLLGEIMIHPSYPSPTPTTLNFSNQDGQPTSPPLFLCPMRPTKVPDVSVPPTGGGGGFSTEPPTITPAPTPIVTSDITAVTRSSKPTNGLGSDAPSLVPSRYNDGNRGSRFPSSSPLVSTEIPSANIIVNNNTFAPYGKLESDRPSFFKQTSETPIVSTTTTVPSNNVIIKPSLNPSRFSSSPATGISSIIPSSAPSPLSSLQPNVSLGPATTTTTGSPTLGIIPTSDSDVPSVIPSNSVTVPSISPTFSRTQFSSSPEISFTSISPSFESISVVPSSQSTNERSIVPSIKPSSVSDIPSLGTTKPTSGTSLIPTLVPSSGPSSVPSSIPSSAPSPLPNALRLP